MLTPEQIMNNQIQKNELQNAMAKAATLIEDGVAVYSPNSNICCFVGVIRYDDEGEKFLETLGSGKNWEEAFSYIPNGFDPEDKI